MKILFPTSLLLLFALVNGCNSNNSPSSAKTEKSLLDSLTVTDTTPRITGIGGIFFKSPNPKATNEWYSKHLGLAIDEYGSPFEFRNANNPLEINYLRWGAFPDSTDYFDPSKTDYMINYRVYNLEALVDKLKSNGVNVVDEIVEYDFGKFVHLMDLDGTKIELWEPNDDYLTTLGGKTTK